MNFIVLTTSSGLMAARIRAAILATGADARLTHGTSGLYTVLTGQADWARGQAIANVVMVLP